jgi:hypothetical protein
MVVSKSDDTAQRSIRSQSAIERYWRHLKAFSCANRLIPSMPTLVDSVLVNLNQQNDQRNLNRFTIRKDSLTST